MPLKYSVSAFTLAIATSVIKYLELYRYFARAEY
eukprot:SAG31_NODE_33255_length_346_cov_0.542510_2_plen_33_part_01